MSCLSKNCWITGKRTGQHTNSGCNCLRPLPLPDQLELKKRIKELEKELDSAKYAAELLAKSADWDIINALAEVDLAEAALEDAKAEIAEKQALFDMCHKRTMEADKLWQVAHNKPNVLPDLGKLVEWLLLRLQNQETIIEANSATVKAKDKLIEQMRREALELALTECRSTHCENEIKAALSAAERGGK